jgi:TPR repeat protein
VKSVNRIIRYVLAAIAVYRAFAFFVFISSPNPKYQEDAGMSLAAAVICGAIAAIMFYRARNEDVDIRPKPDAKEFRYSDSAPSTIPHEQEVIQAPQQQDPSLAFTDPVAPEVNNDSLTVPKEGNAPSRVDQTNWNMLIALAGVALAFAIVFISVFVAHNNGGSINTVNSGQANVDVEKITPTMLAEAKAGNADAQARVGRAYWQGAGVPKDYVQAVSWFRKAAEQGNALAQVSLGILYDGALEEAKGVPQDYAQAAVWYRKAADQGNGLAEYMLGRLYANGQGVHQDYAQAAVWYRKAAEQDGMMASAQSALGTLYTQGKGVPRDYAQAAVWYRKAADLGDADGQLHLGVFYFYGSQDIPQDYKQAAAWYRKAADQGNDSAQYLLGQLYENGQGVPQDYAQAADWYRKAAEQGNSKAQVLLGAFYDKGTGVPQSYADAHFWFNLAVADTKGDERETLVKARDFEAGKLTPLELSQAQERATAWVVKHQQK